MEIIILSVVLLVVVSFLSVPSKDTKSFNGGLVEGGWIQLAVAAVGAYAQSRQDRSNSRDEAVQDRLALMTRGDEDRRTSAFEAALQDYYGQQGNDRARKSLANFARFSTAPQSDTPYYTPEAPTKLPSYTDYANPENRPQTRKP